MRRTIVLALLAVAAACDHQPPTVASRPAHGITPTPQDELVVVNDTMYHFAYGFAAPVVDGLSGFPRAQAATDAVALSNRPRMLWGLRLPVEGEHGGRRLPDLLDIAVFDGIRAGADEGELRAFGSAALESSKRRGMVVREDTVEWHDAVHEYRQMARDTIAGRDRRVRCVASGMSRAKPILVCFTALGPTAASTLERVVMGLRLTTPRPVAAGGAGR